MNNTNTSIITLNEEAQAVREHPALCRSIFQNSEFGELEVMYIDDKAYFPATECAKILGYSNPRDAIQKHCRWVAKRDVPHPQSPDKTIEKNYIPEGDLYRLITHSNLPAAEKFESWVFDDVLPTIRRQGYYSAIPDEELFNAIKNKMRLGDGSFRDGMQAAEREVRNERWVETEMMWNNRGDLTLLNVDERVAEIWKDDREMYAKAKSHVRGLLREDMRTAGWLPWKKCVWATKKPSNKGDDSPETFFRVADIEGGCTIRDLKRMLHELEDLKARVMSAI